MSSSSKKQSTLPDRTRTAVPLEQPLNKIKTVGELIHELRGSKLYRVYNALIAIRKQCLRTAEDITAFRRHDGLRRLLDILGRGIDDKSLQVVLSILGNCCTDERCRHTVLELGGIPLLCNLLHNTSSDSLFNRLCRTLANLSQNSVCCDLIHEHTMAAKGEEGDNGGGDIVRMIVRYMATCTDSECRQTICRTLRALANNPDHTELVVIHGGVKTIAHQLTDAIATGDADLTAAVLKALSHFMDSSCTEACAAQLAAGNVFVSLVSLASRDPKISVNTTTAAIILTKIGHNRTLSPYLGRTGGVAYYIREIEAYLDKHEDSADLAALQKKDKSWKGTNQVDLLETESSSWIQDKVKHSDQLGHHDHRRKGDSEKDLKSTASCSDYENDTLRYHRDILVNISDASNFVLNTEESSWLKRTISLVSALCYSVRWSANAIYIDDSCKHKLFPRLLHCEHLRPCHRRVVDALLSMCVADSEENMKGMVVRESGVSGKMIVTYSRVEKLFRIPGTMNVLIRHIYRCTGINRRKGLGFDEENVGDNLDMVQEDVLEGDDYDDVVVATKELDGLMNTIETFDDGLLEEQEEEEGDSNSEMTCDTECNDSARDVVVGVADCDDGQCLGGNFTVEEKSCLSEQHHIAPTESTCNEDFSLKSSQVQEEIVSPVIVQLNENRMRYSINSPTYKAVSERQVSDVLSIDPCPLNMWEGVSLYSVSPPRGWTSCSRSPAAWSIPSSSPIWSSKQSPTSSTFSPSRRSGSSPELSPWQSPADTGRFSLPDSSPSLGGGPSPFVWESPDSRDCYSPTLSDTDETLQPPSKIIKLDLGPSSSLLNTIIASEAGIAREVSPQSDSGCDVECSFRPIVSGTMLNNVVERGRTLETERYAGDWSPPIVRPTGVRSSGELRGGASLSLLTSGECRIITDEQKSLIDNVKCTVTFGAPGTDSSVCDRESCFENICQPNEPRFNIGETEGETLKVSGEEREDIVDGRQNLANVNDLAELRSDALKLPVTMKTSDKSRMRETYKSFISFTDHGDLSRKRGHSLTSPGASAIIDRDANVRVKRMKIEMSIRRTQSSAACVDLTQVLGNTSEGTAGSERSCMTVTSSEHDVVRRFASAEQVLKLVALRLCAAHDPCPCLLRPDVIQCLLDHVTLTCATGAGLARQSWFALVNLVTNPLGLRRAVLGLVPEMIDRIVLSSEEETAWRNVCCGEKIDEVGKNEEERKKANLKEECSKAKNNSVKSRALSENLLGRMSLVAFSKFGCGEILNILLCSKSTADRVKCAISVCYLVSKTRKLSAAGHNIVIKCLTILLEMLKTFCHSNDVDSIDITTKRLYASVSSSICGLARTLLSEETLCSNFAADDEPSKVDNSLNMGGFCTDDNACAVHQLSADSETYNKVVSLDNLTAILKVSLDDGTIFSVSRAALIRSSPVFAAMLDAGSFAEARASSIHIADVSAHAFRLLMNIILAFPSSSSSANSSATPVSFISHAEDNFACFNNDCLVLVDTLRIADRYLLDSAVRILVPQLMACINADNVFNVYDVSVRLGCADSTTLTRRCLVYALTHEEKVTSNHSSVLGHLLRTLLSSSTHKDEILSAVSEMLTAALS